MEQRLLDLFEAVNIDYFKIAPSSTNVHQPCDVSTNFRDVKTGLKMVLKKGIDTSVSSTVAAPMAKVFQEFKQAYPNILSDALRKKMVGGIEKIHWVLSEKYFTGGKARKGFVECGQHIPGTKPGELSVDYDLMMSKCMRVILEDEFADMKAKKELVVDEFRLHGRVSTQFLDDLGIPSHPSDTVRDDLALCRQDCLLVTHASSQAWYAEYQRKRREATDPVLINLRKRIDKAEKRLRKKYNLELAKEARERAKEEKKVRHSTMIKAEIRKEADDIRKQKKLVQTAKDDLKAAEDEESFDLLGEEAVARIRGEVYQAMVDDLDREIEDEEADD